MDTHSPHTHPPQLIGPEDPPVVERVNPDGRCNLVLCCDHASRAVPKFMGNLGLDADQFDRHIAYDIGAEAVTRNLCDSLDAQAVLAGYSRLILDLNRPPGHPDQMPEISDGTVILPNQSIDEEERLMRMRELFEPYHTTLRQALVETWARMKPPALFSVHSFTPRFGTEHRPWDVGILWNRDPRLAVPLIEKLRALGLHVGDNEPYSGRQIAYTINCHGASSGLANVVIEINQDQVMDPAGIERWCGILTDVLKDVISSDDLFEARYY